MAADAVRMPLRATPQSTVATAWIAIVAAGVDRSRRAGPTGQAVRGACGRANPLRRCLNDGCPPSSHAAPARSHAPQTTGQYHPRVFVAVDHCGHRPYLYGHGVVERPSHRPLCAEPVRHFARRSRAAAQAPHVLAAKGVQPPLPAGQCGRCAARLPCDSAHTTVARPCVVLPPPLRGRWSRSRTTT